MHVAHAHMQHRMNGEPLWVKKPKSSKSDGICARRNTGESDLNCYKCVQRTSLPQKLPHHPRSVLKASSGAHREVWSFREVLMVTSHRVDEYKCQRYKSTKD